MSLKASLFMLLAVLVAPATACAACSVENKASIRVQVVGGTIIIPLEVNGTTAAFILDTGAQRSLVSEPAAQRLGLARDQWVGTTMRGIGGIDRRPNADPRSLSLGGIPLARRTVNHDTSLTVGLLPGTHPGNPTIDGVLGRDYLSLFDLDLDLPHSSVTLYEVHGCTGRFLPWTSGYDPIPVTFPAENALVLRVFLDSVPLQALLDTGASASLLAAPGMFRIGLQSAALAADPTDQVSGIGSRMVTMHRHTFHTLLVGGQLTDSPVIWVAPICLTPIVDMLLGADWLAGRRVWISYATQQLFVANH